MQLLLASAFICDLDMTGSTYESRPDSEFSVGSQRFRQVLSNSTILRGHFWLGFACFIFLSVSLFFFVIFFLCDVFCAEKFSLSWHFMVTAVVFLCFLILYFALGLLCVFLCWNYGEKLHAISIIEVQVISYNPAGDSGRARQAPWRASGSKNNAALQQCRCSGVAKLLGGLCADLSWWSNNELKCWYFFPQ